MAKPIYVVGGSKGGVGKSLVAMALTHLLSEKGQKVFVIDADTSNPDVFKSYGSVRIPTKPAMHSNMKPATCSDPKPATVPI